MITTPIVLSGIDPPSFSRTPALQCCVTILNIYLSDVNKPIYPPCTVKRGMTTLKPTPTSEAK